MVFENIPTWEILVFVGLIILFFINGGIIAGVIIWRYKWSFRVAILENVSGKGFVVSRYDRARLIKVGDEGQEIFYLRKSKVNRIGYGKRIGNKYIGWAISSENGYWYNFSFGDLDKKLLEIGVIPVDRDMRFAYQSLRDLVKSNYDKKTFLEKWGTTIAIGMIIIAIIVQGAGYYVNAKKQLELAQVNNEGARISKEIAEINKQILNNLDTIQSGGSGFVQVPT